MGLDRVRIILVEPAGPMNVGSIARVMKNFGLNHLVLVNPQCQVLSTEALKMAVHAKDILHSAVSVTTVPEALQGCTRAIATTARVRNWDSPLENPSTTLPWLLEEPQHPAALIFGREDRGLSNEELNYAQRFIRIPTSSSYPSLNLATAVAICCYELAQSDAENQEDTTKRENFGAEKSLVVDALEQVSRRMESVHRHEDKGNISDKFSASLSSDIPTSVHESAPLNILEEYYQQLESLLLKIGYLYPHTAASRMETFRQMYNRAQLQTREVAMLRGILRQVEWALENRNNR
ncbi:RNA methyltransferase [Brasilonema sp. UFV-L1]|uniref:RNA methyltransferase n=1 Tax=Brasilonema sp. UFV-L1 TaxID=2234130 RepID=UPI00145CDFEF|nr:RNA methyltransferase [Brasilonema sp. UFV-L1]NMG11452.1 RNA methyltransferase [Brasilonema sp. UFV-L1]